MIFWLDINDLCMWFVEIHKNLHENAWMYLAAWNFISIWKNVLYKYFCRTICVQTIFSRRLHIKSSCQCTLKVSTTWNSLVAKIKLFMHIYERTYIYTCIFIALSSVDGHDEPKKYVTSWENIIWILRHFVYMLI